MGAHISIFFQFGTNGKLMVLGVLLFKHITESFDKFYVLVKSNILDIYISLSNFLSASTIFTASKFRLAMMVYL